MMSNRLHKTFLVCLLGVLFLASYGQVYNYSPIQIYDIETNPSILSSKEAGNRIQLMHQNAIFSSNPFMFNSVRLAKYFERTFTGVGITLNNTKAENGIFYNHIGIGVGYRNILFNQIAIRLGCMYKLSSIKAPAGGFDYLSFIPSEEIVHSKVNSNVNLSLTLSYGIDKLYLSAGYLNLNIPVDNKDNEFLFPTYLYVNMGNFLTFIGSGRRFDLSYTSFIRKNVKLNIEELSHFINYKQSNVIMINRNSSISLGLRLGLIDDSFFQIAPNITYYNRNIAINYSYCFYNDKSSFKSVFIATSQLNIVFAL